MRQLSLVIPDTVNLYCNIVRQEHSFENISSIESILDRVHQRQEQNQRQSHSYAKQWKLITILDTLNNVEATTH